ncbi:Adenylosuccinate synthetase [Humidesulfovibrio mexicanus]|uniref:Adenylosuccinate synthetase n=1 Tax=Humidesulfovibrio mexicanus TaxID=147047 RepID=A0A239B5Y5_9BACT|nr:adenylosuccinate synthetase [Humidesulfovibrio mexicanus]SNS03092.1 Adenylosuccinate synthetase [Humidesulfovibrio mexicanus]
MPVSVVVGGQFGGEGKGKVAHFFAKEQEATAVVRCGGSNSGHTVVAPSGQVHIFRHLPTAAILPGVQLYMSAGSYIDVEVLQKEIASINLDPRRLIIDENAVVVGPEHRAKEREDLVARISSTGSGTGAAVADRVMRRKDLLFAKDCAALKPMVGNVSGMLRERLNAKERVLIEGTQGFGLSLLHSPHYPFVTSRDTTAAAFVAEAGLSPLDVDDIILTLRAFSIRVGGGSGPLPNEITWEELANEAGRPDLMEYTSVTKKPRRVARFDSTLPSRAVVVNNPTKIVLNHLDYIKSAASDVTVADAAVKQYSAMILNKIDYFGTCAASVRRMHG